MSEQFLKAAARFCAGGWIALALLLAALPGKGGAQMDNPAVSNVVSPFTSAIDLGNDVGVVALSGAIHVNSKFWSAHPLDPCRLNVNLVGVKGESVAQPLDPCRVTGPTAFTVEVAGGGEVTPNVPFYVHVFYDLVPPDPIVPPDPVRVVYPIQTTFQLTLDDSGALTSIEAIESYLNEG